MFRLGARYGFVAPNSVDAGGNVDLDTAGNLLVQAQGFTNIIGSYRQLQGGEMNRRDFLAGVGALASSTQLGMRLEEENGGANYGSCRVAAYYFGDYHPDERNFAEHGPGWTEWNLVKSATPRFPGHHQPRIPLWGYEDESDPRVFEKKIAAATAGKIDAFIFDWYWYKDGPFLQAALTDGYLRASNCRDLKFGVMWANHDWFDIQPAKFEIPAIRCPKIAVGQGPLQERSILIPVPVKYKRVYISPYMNFLDLSGDSEVLRGRQLLWEK